MNVKMDLDVREFTDTIRQYAAVSKKDAQEVVLDRAGKLSFELFKQFRAITPSISKLKGLPAALGNRIKRKPGKTIAQEIKRRIGARLTAAAGWIPAVAKLSKRTVTIKKRNVKGSVTINMNEPSVTIENDMLQAFKAEEKHHVMQKSINAQVADMTVYINRKLEQRAKQFSAK